MNKSYSNTTHHTIIHTTMTSHLKVLSEATGLLGKLLSEAAGLLEH